MLSARSCQTLSSGGRALLFFDPDFDKAPDIPRNGHTRQDPLYGVGRKSLELLPKAAVENGLQNRREELDVTIHIDGAAAAIPCPYLDSTRHRPSIAETQIRVLFVCLSAQRRQVAISATTFCEPDGGAGDADRIRPRVTQRASSLCLRLPLLERAIE